MPLYKTIKVNSHTKVYVWKVTESFQELKETIFLQTKSEDRVQKMKSKIHQCGFLSIRHLLKEAGYTDNDLYYSNSGKPHLKDEKHISITHSFQFSAIVISDKEVGIDIEKCRDKVIKIASKFTENKCLSSNKEDKIKQLTAIWGAKESLYKIYPYEGLLFRKHIKVDDFGVSDRKSIAWIEKGTWNKSYKVSFVPVENYMLVYALPFC